MATVVLGERPPELESWLIRRRELGQDRYDEVWEGDYHVAPGPSAEHAIVDGQVTRLRWPQADRVDLLVTTAFNLGEPEDYRVPDGGLHRDRPAGVFAATAAMVIEVVGPGDEALAKLAFYARRAVVEVLVADPARRTVRMWQLRGGSSQPEPHYEETDRSDLLAVTGTELAAEISWP
jgi:Putative restriction endonuclease